MFTLFLSLLGVIILFSGGFGQNGDLNPPPLTPLQSMKREKANLVEDIKGLEAKLTTLKLANKDLKGIEEVSSLYESLLLKQKEIERWIFESETLDKLVQKNKDAVGLYATYSKISFEKKRPQGFWGNVLGRVTHFLQRLF